MKFFKVEEWYYANSQLGAKVAITYYVASKQDKVVEFIKENFEVNSSLIKVTGGSKTCWYVDEIEPLVLI